MFINWMFKYMASSLFENVKNWKIIKNYIPN
jgi:hypothetical protein